MGFLMYAGDEGEISAQVISDICDQGAMSAIEVFFSMDTFVSRLLEIPRHFEAVVVIAGTEDLDRLSGAWERIFPSRLVLLLKQVDEATLAKASRLLPSFLGTARLDVHNVAPVLAKIAGRKTQQG